MSGNFVNDLLNGKGELKDKNGDYIRRCINESK